MDVILKAENSQQKQVEAKIKSDLDFINNARPALVIYIVAWLCIALSTDFYDRYPILTIQLTWLLVGLSFFRYLHIVLHRFLYQKWPIIWLSTHYLLLLLHTLFWAGFYGYQLSIGLLSQTLLATVFFIAIMVSGASYSMRAKPWAAQLYIGAILCPAIWISWQQSDLHFIAYLLSFHWLLLLINAVHQSKNYLRDLQREVELDKKDQAFDLHDKTDKLTQIFNRQYFEGCLHYQWQIAIRSHTTMALMMIDIDHFKQINAQYGYEIGDACLVHVAKLIRQCAKRYTDRVVRYDGDEFVLILPDTKQDEAVKLAESIRNKLQLDEGLLEKKILGLTASIGVGLIEPKQFTSPTLLLQQAEMALFQAKTNGRNRVEVNSFNL